MGYLHIAAVTPLRPYLFFSFLLILFVQPFFIQILYISKRLVSGFSRLASFLLSI